MLKVRKVNFSKDGNHTAIYVDGQLAINTKSGTEYQPEIDELHIEIWIEGLLWGTGTDKGRLDWLTINCTDEALNALIVSGGLPPAEFHQIKTA